MLKVAEALTTYEQPLQVDLLSIAEPITSASKHLLRLFSLARKVSAPYFVINSRGPVERQLWAQIAAQ